METLELKMAQLKFNDMKIFFSKLVVCVSLGCMMGASYAGVVISGTRIIYPAQAREVSVKLENKNTTPSLVQSWVDTGNEDEPPEKSTAPFFLNPPLVRIEPLQGQAIRLIYNGKSEIKDRESVFWFNMLEIPPEPEGDVANNPYLQIAVRTRIKIFFRPQGLSGSAESAPRALVWRVKPGADGNFDLECENPTLFHVSFSKIQVKQGEQVFDKKDDSLMVAPMSKLVVRMVDLKTMPDSSAEVHFGFISDHGAYINLTKNIEP